ncbi:Major facilitator superfamily domain, general substrate transporter [Artemisia annua]|uniref:Major facilitator superfamily domain, general substrate transporter n=1 Tax=Artemisia annua TaxID=35608 RepID=A0A2U1PZV6_ARTAN|nr:Major facilitator superfamily domain, general substrate transporter [Artemisia annua]
MGHLEILYTSLLLTVQNIYASRSPFTRSVQVCVAAYEKTKLHMVYDPKLLYDNEELKLDLKVKPHNPSHRLTGKEQGISILSTMAIGFEVSVLATLVAGFIEIKSKKAAFAHGLTYKPHETIPISVSVYPSWGGWCLCQSGI